MGINDFAGANNPVDAEGTGTLDATGPLPAMPATPDGPPPVDLTQDPRYQAVLSRLQPPPQPTGWQGAVGKILPLLGAIVAMHNNAGGAFVNSWQGLEQQKQAERDKQIADDTRLANILHQQAQEKIASDRITQASRTAQARIDAQAKKDQATKTDNLLRDQWKSLSEGGLVDTLNGIVDTQGPDAADQYLSGTHLGSLTDDGIQHTLKDLADRYAVKDPTGHYLGGKTKTPKETKAGTQEDWVSTAETLESQRIGRPLTDQERQTVDATAIRKYKDLSRDPDAAELTRSLKQIQIDLANQEKERRQQVIDKGYEDQYGSAPQIFQNPDGTIHGYVYDKTNHKIIEVPTVIPPGSSRIQPPSAWQKFLNAIGAGGGSTPPVVRPTGATDPTDPNWGKKP